MSGLPDLAGKIAVVTGGASGIGKGIAARLAAEGALVIIAHIERDALEATAAELGVFGVRTDVSDAASVESLARTVVERHGTVHVICNVVRAIKRGDLYAFTHPDWYPQVAARHEAIAAAFAAQAAEAGLGRGKT